MNKELESQLSAMFDDELPAAECELLARRLSRDEQLRERWGRYAVIGAVSAPSAEYACTAPWPDGSAQPSAGAALGPDPPVAPQRAASRLVAPLAGLALAAGGGRRGDSVAARAGAAGARCRSPPCARRAASARAGAAMRPPECRQRSPDSYVAHPASQSPAGAPDRAGQLHRGPQLVYRR